MDLREIGWYGRDWIELAQDRDQWRALVNTVMNLQVPYNCWNFLNGCTIAASQEGLSSVSKMSIVVMLYYACAMQAMTHYRRYR
jgi:hypothetical protein